MDADAVTALADSKEETAYLYGIELSGPTGELTVLSPIELAPTPFRRSSAPPPASAPWSVDDPSGAR